VCKSQIFGKIRQKNQGNPGEIGRRNMEGRKGRRRVGVDEDDGGLEGEGRER